MIVETALAGDGRALLFEHEPKGLFGAGLADAAGDGDDFGVGALARGGS